VGLAIYREFGSPDDPGVVSSLCPGFLEVSEIAAGPPGRSMMIWIQARDVRAEHARLAAAGVPIIQEPQPSPGRRPRCGSGTPMLHTALAHVAATALTSDGREWAEVVGRRFCDMTLALQ
jgi:hypothetical protein